MTIDLGNTIFVKAQALDVSNMYYLVDMCLLPLETQRSLSLPVTYYLCILKVQDTHDYNYETIFSNICALTGYKAKYMREGQSSPWAESSG